MPDWAKALCVVCVIVSMVSVCFVVWLRRSMKAHLTHGGAGLRGGLVSSGGNAAALTAQW